MVLIFHHYRTDDDIARTALRYLEESGRKYDLGKGRSYVFHRAHVPGAKDHIHFLQRGRELYALNRDGTAHDRSHGAQMHGWAMDAIKQRYPDFVIPAKGLIEAMFEGTDARGEVSSSADGRPAVLVDPQILWVAQRKALFFPDPTNRETRAGRPLRRIG